jgi:4-amino-4-deoxy-L-arabinose transferase-like glycosyltransferase
VFRRVCGTFKQLMDQLEVTGFVPLHYWLYWSIAHFTTMTPVVMRLPPAIAGTLMVPAIYAVAVQMVPRPTALLAALLAATSAFLCHYSRDAKMYSPAWFLMTVNVACLLWWLRMRGVFPWIAWVISGILMAGYHATTAMVLGVEVVMLITHGKPHWKLGPLFVAGLLIIAVPMALWYIKFNHFHERMNTEWQSVGLAWIDWYDSDRDAMDLYRYTGTNFLFNWDWPAQGDERQMHPFALKYGEWAGIILFSVIALGAIPWRTTADAGVPRRSMLWLLAWLMLPAYGICCASMPDLPSPLDWPATVWADPLMRRYAMYAMLGIALLLVQWKGVTWWSRLSAPLAAAAIVAVIIGLSTLVYAVVPVQQGPIWMPRYVGVCWPAFCILVAVLLNRLPTPPIRWLAIGLVLFVNIFSHYEHIFGRLNSPTDVIAADILADQDDKSPVRTYFGLESLGLFDWANSTRTCAGPYYLYTMTHTPTTPDDYMDRFDAHFRIRDVPSDNWIVREAGSNPSVHKIIIWDRVGRPEENPEDQLKDLLGSKWKRTDQETYNVCDMWTWKIDLTARRRVYERQ